jgi:hypothetical protein
MATENERQCDVVEYSVDGSMITAILRIKGGLQNKTGMRTNWSINQDYTLKIHADLEDVLERYGAERKIAMARLLRNTSADFVKKVNNSETPWTVESLTNACAPYQIADEDLDEMERKALEKLMAIRAKKAARE